MSLSARRAVPALALVFVLAVALRLLWALWTAPVPAPLADEEFYNAAALSLARGLGYHVTFGAHWLPGGAPTAFWPPGFPAFIALIYRIFGEHLAVARVANAIAGALVVIPVYWIGARLFDRRAALAGALIAALLPSLVFWTPVLLSDTLFTTLFAAAVACLLWAMPEPAAPGARLRPLLVVSGALAVALAVYVRGEALVVVPVVAAWWWAGGVSLRPVIVHTALASAIVVAALAPWAVRSTRALDSPVLLATNFGYNLRAGHAPYSTGRYIVPQDLWDADPGISFEDRELLFNRLGRQRAVDYARHNPGREAVLSARKIVWLWRPDSDVSLHVQSYGLTPLPAGAWPPLRILLDVTYFAVLALAGLALWRRRDRGHALLFPIVLVLVWTGVHVVFFGEPRYHLPLLAVLAPMAGATLTSFATGRHADAADVRAPSAGDAAELAR